MIRWSFFVVLTLASACQTYDFEPVQAVSITQTTQSKNVISRNLKPNLMILVDKSGSMNQPINASAPGCGNCSGASCPASCPTRISELRTAMGQFLVPDGRTGTAVARLGLAFFPNEDAQFNPNGCAPTKDISVRLPEPTINDADAAALSKNAKDIDSRIQMLGSGITVIGGTPTSGALNFMGSYPGLLDDKDNRQDFVLLLTDGLPNCNVSNPLACNSSPPPAANLCTLGANCTGAYCRAGYIDREGVIGTVLALRAKNINTIVVGFGADFAEPLALDVLNSMATAGGFARACPKGTNAECGSNNTCLPTKVCEKQFYAASNALELSTALANITNLINPNDPCLFDLQAQPPDSKFLAVIVDGQTQPGGPATWKFEGGKVQFQGPLCERVKAATPADPLKLEIRIVSTL